MRHARRVIAIITGCAAWCVAAATVAYAKPDPGGGVIITPPPPSAAETPIWQFIAVAALGALLAVAVVGLVASLRHQRASSPSGMLHA